MILSNLYGLAYAQENINYDYIEVGYGQLKLNNNISANGIYFEGSFVVSDRFYLAGHYETRQDKSRDFDRYDLTLGFHTNGSGSTDFYIDARVGELKYDNVDGTSVGFFAGSRSAFGKHFELITKIGFIHVDGINHEDGDSTNIYEAEVKGLFKFTDHQGLSVSIEGFDGKIGARIGYRYSF